MDLLNRLNTYRAQEEQLRWDGSFADYLELVRLGHGPAWKKGDDDKWIC